MTRRPGDIKPLCPVCHQPVEPTRTRSIAGHMDKAHHPCPGSNGIPYELALTDHLDGIPYDSRETSQ